VGGATDPNGDPLRIVVTGITQDEPVNGRGGGNTFPDAQFTAAGDQVLLRAERSGRGDGRVYRLSFSVTDPSGASCSGVVTVTVPHDQSHAAVDSGGSFNSLVAAAGPQPSPGNRAKPTPNKP
jgi:hypothetical protein